MSTLEIEYFHNFSLLNERHLVNVLKLNSAYIFERVGLRKKMKAKKGGGLVDFFKKFLVERKIKRKSRILKAIISGVMSDF